jgi:hypothetical protein
MVMGQTAWWTYVVMAQQPDVLPPSSPIVVDDGLPTVYVTILGFALTLLTSLVGIFAQLFREGRNRKWEKEDRDRTAAMLATKVVSTASDVAVKVEQTAQAAATQTQTLIDKVEENTALTKEAAAKADGAYNEANALNQKIAVLTKQFMDNGTRHE